MEELRGEFYVWNTPGADCVEFLWLQLGRDLGLRSERSERSEGGGEGGLDAVPPGDVGGLVTVAGQGRL